MRTARLPLALLAAGLLVITAACGSDDAADDAAAAPAGTEATTGTEATDGTEAPAGTEAPTGTEAATPPATDAAPASDAPASDVALRLGYFPNVTHAPAIIGVDTGLFADALGSTATLETSTFNSGTEVVEAIFSGAIDASFIGPNPAINAYSKSDGEAIRIVAGTTSGGASLVVREGIDDAAGLAGVTLAVTVARQHAGRRAPGVAARTGLRDRHQRWWRRAHHAAGQRRHARRLPVRCPRRRLGA